MHVLRPLSHRLGSPSPPSIRALPAIAAMLLALICSGCQTISFYSQAVGGQVEMWKKRQSIESLLNDSTTPADLRQRLQLVLNLRAFAETNLGLPIRGQYLSYADLQRPYAVWSVYAAPEFSLSPKSWWYPIVGKLDYRGYFSESDARAYATRLRAQGYDVHTGGVTAYSTLGWFQDPVLNTFIHESDSELAELLFHELAHQRLFIPHDTEFNEAFATAVAQEGTRRWLISRGDTSALDRYEHHLRQTKEFTTQIASARDRLNNLYTNLPAKMSASEAMEAQNQKDGILNELRLSQAGLPAGATNTTPFARWFQQDINNALLNTVDTYHRLVPMLHRHLDANAKGYLPRFYREMEHLKKNTKDERRTFLATMLTPAGEAGQSAFRKTAPEPSGARPATRE
jgi:predicted aminopeptidase